jgi:predicted enzyme related to lactoylglutathione lyase
VPPLAESGAEHPGKVVWHDLVTPDLPRARDFYGALFGWSFEEASSGYLLARNEGQPVAGLARLDRADASSHWLPLVSVPDVDRAAQLAAQRGGETLLAPFELPGRGRIAVVRDPLGAAFGVVRSASGDPADAPPPLHGFLWHEVWTDEPDVAAGFYAELAGYEAATRRVFDVDYRYLARDGTPRVGLVEKPDAEIGNTWVVYVRVADARASAERARALGGRVLMAPRDDVRAGSVAVLADPDGAGFVVQEWTR